MLANFKEYLLEDTVEGPPHIMWFHIKCVSSQTKQSGCFPLFSLYKATAEMMWSALSFPKQES